MPCKIQWDKTTKNGKRVQFIKQLKQKAKKTKQKTKKTTTTTHKLVIFKEGQFHPCDKKVVKATTSTPSTTVYLINIEKCDKSHISSLLHYKTIINPSNILNSI